MERKGNRMYIYKSLENVSYDEIATCLNNAFSDYYLPLYLSEEQLQGYFRTSGVDRSLSYGAFTDNQMVGFIINSCNIFNGQKVVFDAGTGVIPEHRGKKVFTNLFRFANQELQKHKIQKYYLEVLQQNDKAINSYKKQGFSITRELLILRGSNCLDTKIKETVDYIDFQEFDFNMISTCNYVQPSYENSTDILKINPDYYAGIYKEKNNNMSAFCIFSKGNGYIHQLGYNDISELKIIIQYLLSKHNNIVVKNIDRKYTQVLEVFYSLGFGEVAKQFEMVLNLCGKD